ncbi:hypothetical protein ERX46_15630 [Brumimicrobium glaciale]|uniref:Uncharacterized protein n=1 Tax=Brumimicrobium glaciale TaxID=200475 RepID=A0A4Q4KG56_9FLAO|nr:hypothetical protein [Brumimicrobium glaciale]RYM32111.1 hypothetical protein ERX46_15630 [Brumimicrobium glaciale]
MKNLNQEIGNLTNQELKSNENKFEQAVIVYFKEIKVIDEVHELKDILEAIILKNKLGFYDGQETACDNSEGSIYMYGSHATKLFEAIRPTLEKTAFMDGAIANLIFGPLKEGVKQTLVKIRTNNLKLNPEK